jgi:hypothetical protein
MRWRNSQGYGCIRPRRWSVNRISPIKHSHLRQASARAASATPTTSASAHAMVRESPARAHTRGCVAVRHGSSRADASLCVKGHGSHDLQIIVTVFLFFMYARAYMWMRRCASATPTSFPFWSPGDSDFHDSNPLGARIDRLEEIIVTVFSDDSSGAWKGKFPAYRSRLARSRTISSKPRAYLSSNFVHDALLCGILTFFLTSRCHMEAMPVATPLGTRCLW